jgi:L-ascorbate metabolism protein UlaG (beta-lactamase superfamily)
MIEPALADDAFLADVAQARRQRDRLHLWWLGQSGFLIAQNGRCALLDPYLSDSLTHKYAGTDKPHVRMTRRVIDPRRLDFVSVVSSSHNHTDHLDAETIRPLLEVNPDLQIVIPEANREFVAKRLNPGAPGLPMGVDDGLTVSAGGFSFTGVPAAHETVERDEEGQCRFLGYIVRAGRWTIYHSGDTVLYDGMIDRLRQFEIDVALLPINGRAPERRVAGNLNGPEAAQLAHDIRARLVIPCHYDMFGFNTASPAVFFAECQRLGQPCRVLKAGERWTTG